MKGKGQKRGESAAARRKRRLAAARRAKRKREERSRLRQANDLLRVIASTGRKFFRWRGRVAHFELGKRGHVMFVDHYNGKRMLVRYLGTSWPGFTSGGTMRELVSRLGAYVKRGEKLPSRILGPWPDWICDGDLWGYGADMEKVREAGNPLLAEPREWPPPDPRKKGSKKR